MYTCTIEILLGYRKMKSYRLPLCKGICVLLSKIRLKLMPLPSVKKNYIELYIYKTYQNNILRENIFIFIVQIYDNNLLSFYQLKYKVHICIGCFKYFEFLTINHTHFQCIGVPPLCGELLSWYCTLKVSSPVLSSILCPAIFQNTWEPIFIFIHRAIISIFHLCILLLGNR